MPRNACTSCRLRKVKCVVQKPDVACEQCSVKGMSCSYVPTSSTQSQRRIAESAEINHIPLQGSPFLSSTVSRPTYRLTHPTPSLDIGEGRPEDILQEQELTQSLVILYFRNFNDVHFLFDEEIFLRQYAIGEIPSLILYAVMALGIRFSPAPFRDELPQSHRGQILYERARTLLHQNFDHPSLVNAQACVLLSTYNVTFGGSMKSYIYLGVATTMLRCLRLADESAEFDPLRMELNRRLACTIVLMDRLLSVPLRLAPHVSVFDPVPMMLGDEEFWALKRRLPISSSSQGVSLSGEIMYLSEILVSICNLYRETGNQGQAKFDNIRLQFYSYSTRIPDYMSYSQENRDRHLRDHTFRKFAFMHLLYHHVGMLVHFYSLKMPQADVVSENTHQCHRHAYAVVDIIEYCWSHAGFDLHNLSMGQILTVATVVHLHALLTTDPPGSTQCLTAKLEVMRNCIVRVQKHTRLFNWVLQHLDSFWRICCQEHPSTGIFDRDPALLGRMLQMGTFFESVDPRNGGRVQGLESCQMRDGTIDPSLSTHSHMDIHDPVQFEANDNAYFGQWPLEANIDNFDDFAWIFSDSALSELYSMPRN